MDWVLYFERENVRKYPTIIPNERKQRIFEELEEYIEKEKIPVDKLHHLKENFNNMIPEWQSDVEFLKGWLHLVKDRTNN